MPLIPSIRGSHNEILLKNFPLHMVLVVYSITHQGRHRSTKQEGQISQTTVKSSPTEIFFLWTFPLTFQPYLHVFVFITRTFQLLLSNFGFVSPCLGTSCILGLFIAKHEEMSIYSKCDAIGRPKK